MEHFLACVLGNQFKSISIPKVVRPFNPSSYIERPGINFAPALKSGSSLDAGKVDVHIGIVDEEYFTTDSYISTGKISSYPTGLPTSANHPRSNTAFPTGLPTFVLNR